VVLTRDSNSRREWGPCVDRRGRAGNRTGADLKISIHADGSYGGGPGFHVIAAPDRRPSLRLAKVTRARLRHAGLPVARYTAGADGLDVRSDLATLNLSRIPTVMVELGNMRDRRDARRMTSSQGRATYARALASAAVRFLG
jgi:N-acetylmuramoyl-L-alanine amidase